MTRDDHTSAAHAEVDIERLAARAREASRVLARASSEVKNAYLRALADRLSDRRRTILEANAEDMRCGESAGLPAPKLRRLAMTEGSLAQLCDGVRQIADLPDPVGEVTREREVPSGLIVRKVRAPLGVVAMIYEARPGVTIDAFSLCFKAGNACILKGGKEADHSNRLLASIARDLLPEHGLPTDAMAAITSSDRALLGRLLTLDREIDLVIPRGGEPLIRFVAEHATMPTIQHYHGVCHLYVDADADPAMALRIALAAKISAPATCNALECVLVHERIGEVFVPELAQACAREGVELRGDARSRELATTIIPASDDEWGREYLDLILGLRVVSDLDAACAHIARFGSKHTDAIVTANDATARAFVERVDSSCTLVNASTRFNDGFQLGLGAEIGISTSKIHAFGPMGLEELTTQRYVVLGDGQTR